MAKTAKEDAKATNISPQDIQQCARELDDIDDKVETLNGQRRNLRKRWKNDGIPLGMVDKVRSDKRRDNAEVIQEQKDYQFVAAALNLDLTGAYQADFDFDIPQESREESARYDATLDGKNFGLRGEGPDQNPHPADSVANHAWEVGRLEGLKLQTETPQKAAARKPRKGSGGEMGPAAGRA